MHRLNAKLIHHGFGDLIARTTPNIHDFIVALALGHQTGSVLNFNFLHLFLGRTDNVILLHRREHIVQTD